MTVDTFLSRTLTVLLILLALVTLLGCFGVEPGLVIK